MDGVVKGVGFAEVVRQKYAPGLDSLGQYALRLALGDCEECWADEYSALRLRLAEALDCIHLLERRCAEADERMAALNDELDQSLARLDALEGAWRERSGEKASGSSSPIGASMGLSAAAAPATSSGPARMRSSPAASSAGGGRRKGRASAVSMRSSAAPTTAGGEENFPLPAWWPEAVTLYGQLRTDSGLIRRLETGTSRFRQMAAPERMACLTWFLKDGHNGDLTMTMGEFNVLRPPWLSTSSAIAMLAVDGRWGSVLRMVALLTDGRSTGA